MGYHLDYKSIFFIQIHMATKAHLLLLDARSKFLKYVLFWEIIEYFVTSTQYVNRLILRSLMEFCYNRIWYS